MLLAIAGLFKSRERQKAIEFQQNELLKTIRKLVEKENNGSDLNSLYIEKKIKKLLEQAKDMHNKMDKNIKVGNNLIQAKTNKMTLILTRSLNYIEKDGSAIKNILKGKLPHNFDNSSDNYTRLPSSLGSISKNHFYGTDRVDIANVLLLTTCYALNKKAYEKALKTVLTHELCLTDKTKELNANLQLDSPFIDKEKRVMSVINGGYAFGGMRQERKDWHKDPKFGPEDCSSFVAKLHNFPDLYSTEEQIKIHYGKSQLLSDHMKPVKINDLQPGDIWVIRKDIGESNQYGKSGHTGVVVTYDGKETELMQASRDIETLSLDGIGFGKKKMLAENVSEFIFYLRATKPGLKNAAFGTPFFKNDYANIEKEVGSKSISCLCNWVDKKIKGTSLK